MSNEPQPHVLLISPVHLNLIMTLCGAHRGLVEILKRACPQTPAPPGMIEAARKQYAEGSDDDIEVDDNACMSRADGGTWVQAWVWVKEGE